MVQYRERVLRAVEDESGDVRAATRDVPRLCVHSAAESELPLHEQCWRDQGGVSVRWLVRSSPRVTASAPCRHTRSRCTPSACRLRRRFQARRRSNRGSCNRRPASIPCNPARCRKMFPCSRWANRPASRNCRRRTALRECICNCRGRRQGMSSRARKSRHRTPRGRRARAQQGSAWPQLTAHVQLGHPTGHVGPSTQYGGLGPGPAVFTRQQV